MPTNANYNHILKLMPFLFKWQLRSLVKAYKTNPHSSLLKTRLFVLRYLNLAFIKPFRLLPLIAMSYQGSWGITFKKLHKYITHYFSKHLFSNTLLRNRGVLPF